MKIPLTRGVIEQICGKTAFRLGEAAFLAGKVELTRIHEKPSRYEARVQGDVRGRVIIAFDDDGEVNGACTCTALHGSSTSCEHIAAVLLQIAALQQTSLASERVYPSLLHPEDRPAQKPRESKGGLRLTESVLGLFGDKASLPSAARNRFEQRSLLDVTFLCQVYPYGNHKFMFGIEMKIGPKRQYIVQRIREVLNHIGRQQSCLLSKTFAYEPERHAFRREDDAVIRQLVRIYDNERMVEEALSPSSAYVKRQSGERTLMLPPDAWESLLPLLADATSVQLELEGKTMEGIHFSDDPVPLRFLFDQSPTRDYQLTVEGLDDCVVLEAYRIVLAEGKLLRLPAEACNRLAELKQLFEEAGEQQIRIPQAQMESFVQQVIPGLQSLGDVQIAEAVRQQMVQTPLKARLYLDRVKDRLLASVEFQYGDIVIQPSEGENRKRGEERILIRDGQREQQILALMEQGAFTKTEGGYFLSDEEAEFAFLYEIVPQLEKLADLYATSAVKVRLHVGHAPPKIRANVQERTDWLFFKFEMDGIRDAEIQAVLQSVEDKRKYHRLQNGALLPLGTEAFEQIAHVMREMGIRPKEMQGTELKLPVWRGLQLADAGDGGVVQLGRALRKLIENMRHPDHLDFPLPAAMDAILRDYQKVGFQWLKTLAHYRFGGILADEMGLGKTIQSIAYLVSVLPEIREEKRPALVVAPASLVYNWRNELAKFAPDIRVAIGDGSVEARRRVLIDPAAADVILTSYTLLRRDASLYAKQAFHTLFLDEAQAFKNASTQTAQAVKRLEARHRFALTGTPIENGIDELWSIAGAVFPQLLGTQRAFGELTRETIARRIRPFLLRRLKSDVLQELPEKIESLQVSELLPEQKKLYTAYLAKLQAEALKHLNDKTFETNKIRILAGLTRLRQICCHPALFVEGYTGSSAKFEQLLELVEECRSAGKRILLFSQYTGMLDLIARELGYRGAPFFYLDGSTPPAERVDLCERFNRGERELFLISLKAGGTGLNLTGADTVILYDLWWNPAVEQQATDRAHRIGQKKVVQVIRLLAQGTIEEKMQELQQRKKHLVEEMIGAGQKKVTSLTQQDIRDILQLEEG